MKCVCGYEKGYDFEKKCFIGEEDFIQIDVVATIESENCEGFLCDKKVSIVACPKCNTLILDK